jgi:hypothetical protein
MRQLTALAFSLLALSIPLSVRAEWPLDGAPLCTAYNSQNLPTAVSDGAGGAIITWYDWRNNTPDIFVQRVNAFGVPQWTADGVALCAFFGDQMNPTIVSDGAGGAIVTWYDGRGASFDIYAQRVNAAGVPQWAANGVGVCTGISGNQMVPMIISDGAGGAIIAWQDARNGNNDIFAQRVNSSGVSQWTANGVAVCVIANSQLNPMLASDGASGAIVTWEDQRGGIWQNIWAQRVNAAGSPVWAANGVAICLAGLGQGGPRIVADGIGGAIVAWNDFRSSPDYDIYAQRISSAGNVYWLTNGIAICTAIASQTEVTLMADGASGAIMVWSDTRNGPSDIFAQRISAIGDTRWLYNGVSLCTATGAQTASVIASDGVDGAIVVWGDTRNGNPDLYAQRVSGAGITKWATNGTVVSTAAVNQLSPSVVLTSPGAAIVAWNDSRKSNDYDIYAQRIEFEEGYWGYPEPFIVSVADVKSDQGGKVKVNWTASGRDVRHYDTITHYSIWRAVDAVPLTSAAASGGSIITDLSAIGANFQGPAYREEKSASGAPFYWEWIGNQDALYAPGYSFSASTRADSTTQSAATHYFQVVSHTADPYIFWPSNAVSGHSVDNLAPAAPLLLVAQRIGNYVYLKWNGVHVPDLKDYSVYRKTSAGVTPVPINFLSTSDDTLLTDASAPTSSLYYIVTAYDVHANQSAPSNEAHVSATTGVGNTPPITALTVLDNMPNPFNDKTTLRVGLPRASDVEIDVFDVAGRSVRIEHTAQLAAGWREVAFDAHDAAGHELPSGVYFYRVKAAGETITHKMVIAR